MPNDAAGTEMPMPHEPTVANYCFNYIEKP